MSYKAFKLNKLVCQQKQECISFSFAFYNSLITVDQIFKFLASLLIINQLKSSLFASPYLIYLSLTFQFDQN